METYNSAGGIYFARELSWLAFNERVLRESERERTPLLERVRFVSIVAANLDEFLMVRFAGLLRLVDAGSNSLDASGQLPGELVTLLGSRIRAQFDQLEEVSNRLFSGQLAAKGVFLLGPDRLDAVQRRAARQYFETTLFPLLTPMTVDPGHPFPVLHSGTMAFALKLQRGSEERFALVVVPRVVPRFFSLPSGRREACFTPVEDIIRENLEELFRGCRVNGRLLFRLIRDSELMIRDEFDGDLMGAIESEVRKRPKARVVSVQARAGDGAELLETLAGKLHFPVSEVISVPGLLDLAALGGLAGQFKARPGLVFPAHVPAASGRENIFDRIRAGDFMLHLPYDSFQPTVDLVIDAARDENVLAIKMTLYRTNRDSRIIAALADAARQGKQVTVVVELMARFDEERNIGWTRNLEAAGCHVIYGMPGLKVHAKMLLVIRRENGRIARYTHLSTGNYNEVTARVYTDIGYFSASEDFAADAADIFNMITGFSVSGRYRRIVASPRALRLHFLAQVEREMEFQEKFQNGALIAKMNSLEDQAMIDKLYQASRAGVKMRLIVRGICCLRPGVKGLSENISVRSVVGRFLEHSRIFAFHNNGSERVFLASADWMSRNLDRRVETCFEPARQDIRVRLLEILEAYWGDTENSWRLLPSGRYEPMAGTGRVFDAQASLAGREGRK